MAKAPTTDPNTTGAPTEDKPTAKTRKFAAAFDILQGDKSIGSGKPIHLTEDEHAELFEAGAVTAPWTKAEAAD